MRNTQKTLLAFLFLFIAGCSDHIEQLKLTKEERERILLLQNPFGSNFVRIEGLQNTGAVLIGLNDCTVYRAEPEQGVVTEWIRLSEIDGDYPLPSACSRERIWYDGEYVTIEFCKTPMLASGGCAGGISPHRSKNGKDWEVLSGNNKWKSVDKPATPPPVVQAEPSRPFT